MSAGDQLIAGALAPIKPGNSLQLRSIPVGSTVHGIELKPGKGAQIARSAGASAQLVARDGVYVTLRLRSGEMREGLPPFVLTLENAEGYFNPSSVIRNSAKHGVRALYELPKIKKKYAAFLEDQSP